MNIARPTVVLESLSEFSRLIPKDLGHGQIIDALKTVSIECEFTYSAGRTFLPNGWIAEYALLNTPIRLTPDTDLLLFVTGGEIRVEQPDSSEQYLKSGDQIVLALDTVTTVFPVNGCGRTGFIALAFGLDLAHSLEELPNASVQPSSL